jgi:aspartate/tyrosine/aromatic aminotransferase
MSGRIKDMRKALRDELVALGTPGNWDHIVSQVRSRFSTVANFRALQLKLSWVRSECSLIQA